MHRDNMLITPRTRVGELLKAFPQLEQVLVEIAPAFKKLQNPVLRRTVAKVTSLDQAARVGNVPVAELVRRLRREVDQPDFTDDETVGGEGAATVPEWFDEEKIVGRFDARPLIDSGEQPIGRVLSDLDKLSAGTIYELITPFEPAPLIDRARGKGYWAWSCPATSDRFHTYFYRGRSS